MNDTKTISNYLRTSKLAEVSRLTKVSVPTLLKMKNENYDVHYQSVKAVSDLMDQIFGCE